MLVSLYVASSNGASIALDSILASLHHFSDVSFVDDQDKVQ